VFIGQLLKSFGMAQRKQLEFNLQQLGLRVADLLEDIARDGSVSLLFIRYILDALAQASGVSSGGQAA